MRQFARRVDLGSYTFAKTTAFNPYNSYHWRVHQVEPGGAADDAYAKFGIDPTKFTLFVIVTAERSSGLLDASGFKVRPGSELTLLMCSHDESGAYRTGYAANVTLHVPKGCRLSRLDTHGNEKSQYDATLTFSAGEQLIHVIGHFEQCVAALGLTFAENGNAICNGEELPADPSYLFVGYDNPTPAFTLKGYGIMRKRVDARSAKNLMRWCRDNPSTGGIAALPQEGVKKTLLHVTPFYEAMRSADENITLLATFYTLAHAVKRTVNGVKVAKLFNHLFEKVADASEFKKALATAHAACKKVNSGEYFDFGRWFVELPGYAELRKEALKSQGGRALAKMSGDIDALRFDRERYPLLAELISDSAIPVSTFFRKEGDEAYFLFNDNWALFEEFLGKHREAGVELAKLASTRTTYEKSFMSYLYFVLHGLPEYLERHTGKKWTCLPKLVTSSSELEPPRGERGQTAKRRSALTPVVDNEKRTVTVPYACLKVPGISTTYTYGLDYQVLQRGISIEGEVCTADLEVKLNGRDDYGLMYYTLTGSAQGRGYPTFLVIFERLDAGETRVHFHRTHPLRSKDGDANPVHNWIRTCYNWMVGNVNLASVKAQQGDLVFAAVESVPDGKRERVDSYDSHVFERPVDFMAHTKKDSQNILGYLVLDEDTMLNHVEHLARRIPAGKYELRQCRSWEANPRGVWTLRID